MAKVQRPRARYRGFTIAGWAAIAGVGLLIVVGAGLLWRVVTSQEVQTEASPAASPSVPSCSDEQWLDVTKWTCVPRAQCAEGESYNASTNTCTAIGLTATAINPSTGLMPGGTEVTVSGTGFVPGATVTIDGVPATDVRVLDAQTVLATTPGSSSEYPVDVVVTNPGGASVTLNNAFTYLPVPIDFITELVPPVGSTQGGEAVILKGNDLAQGTTVTFGTAISPDVVFLNDQTLRVVTPPGGVGRVPVSVTLPGRNPWTLQKGFRYADQAPRRVSSVRPAQGSQGGGTRITVVGSGFKPGAQVAIGGAAASKVTVLSATRIRATTPSHSPGLVQVAVRNPGMPAAILDGAFEYVAAPTVTSVSPAEIPDTGGVDITVTGTGFVDGAVVTVDGAKASKVKVVSDTEIRAVAPAGSPGPAVVVVTNPKQPPGELKKAVTYVAAQTPTPTAIPVCKALTLPRASTPLGSDLILTDADLFPASVASPRLTGAGFSGAAGSGTIDWKASPPRIVWHAPVAGPASGTISFSYQAANCSGTGSGSVAVSAS
ncbi:MAG: hypothetical protein GC156_03410 [Actinomycetales bacterium]|nr:hypothetical protein [Actinomycetales bacterium]